MENPKHILKNTRKKNNNPFVSGSHCIFRSYSKLSEFKVKIILNSQLLQSLLENF